MIQTNILKLRKLSTKRTKAEITLKLRKWSIKRTKPESTKKTEANNWKTETNTYGAGSEADQDK